MEIAGDETCAEIDTLSVWQAPVEQDEIVGAAGQSQLGVEDRPGDVHPMASPPQSPRNRLGQIGFVLDDEQSHARQGRPDEETTIRACFGDEPADGGNVTKTYVVHDTSGYHTHSGWLISSTEETITVTVADAPDHEPSAVILRRGDIVGEFPPAA